MGKIIKSGIEYAGGGGGGDVDKQYVDTQDAATLQSAKDYTDGKTPTVVQTTGQSTTDVMSQKAITDAIENVTDGYVQKEELYGDYHIDNNMIHISPDGEGNPSNGDFTDSIILSDIDADTFGASGYKIIIGNHVDANSYLGDGNEIILGSYCRADASSMHLGNRTKALGDGSGFAGGSVLLGENATVDLTGKGTPTNREASVALGAGSVATDWEEVSVGRDAYDFGAGVRPAFNRKITHVADGVANNDAATVGQLNTAIAGVTPPAVVQTIGQSTTNVMSQKAVTDTIYDGGDTAKVRLGGGARVTADDATNVVVIGPLAKAASTSCAIGVRAESAGNGVAVGADCFATGAQSVALGSASFARAQDSIAIKGSVSEPSSAAIAIGPSSFVSETTSIALGANSVASHKYSAAIGVSAETTRQGEIYVGAKQIAGPQQLGYNNTRYRVIGGVHDGVDDHDAVTVGQLNTAVGNIETILAALTTGGGV